MARKKPNNAPDLDNKYKRQFHRSIDTLNSILRAVRLEYPEAEYRIQGSEIRLITEQDKPGDKKQYNTMVTSYLDGDEKTSWEE